MKLLVYTNMIFFWIFFFLFLQIFFKDFIYVFLDRGERREKDRERNTVCGCFLSTPTEDLARNPGMCPDWESNRRPFGSQAWCSIHWVTPARAKISLVAYSMTPKKVIFKQLSTLSLELPFPDCVTSADFI